MPLAFQKKFYFFGQCLLLSQYLVFFVLCQAGLGSQNVTVIFGWGGETWHEKRIGRIWQAGLGSQYFAVLFLGGHSRFWQAGLGSQNSAVFYIAWEENCLGRICQAGLGSQNSADVFFAWHGLPKYCRTRGGGSVFWGQASYPPKQQGL